MEKIDDINVAILSSGVERCEAVLFGREICVTAERTVVALLYEYNHNNNNHYNIFELYVIEFMCSCLRMGVYHHVGPTGKVRVTIIYNNYDSIQ